MFNHRRHGSGDRMASGRSPRAAIPPVSYRARQSADVDGSGDRHRTTRRADGTLCTPRIVWVVRLGDGLYVRSVNGPDAAWYRGARTRMQGRVRAGGLDGDVAFIDADHGFDDAIDDA